MLSGLEGARKFDRSARRVKDTLAQQVEGAPTVHRTLHELVDPTLGLSLAVGQDHRGHYRVRILKQPHGESLQFSDPRRFGLLCPLFQLRVGLLFTLLLLVSEHPGELLEQGAASLHNPVSRL